MYYVYLLMSEKDPSKSYIGYTKDIAERIKTHNFRQAEQQYIRRFSEPSAA